MRKIIFIVISLAFMSSHAMAATLDPDLKFYTRETAHFSIHYQQGLEQTADRAAGLAEQAHAMLTKALGWTPEGEKTHLVLADRSDFANGFATVLPYNLIYIYVVPPHPDMTIGQYDQWLAMAIVHEYAHVLTMDAARGYSSLTRKVFGKPMPGADPLSFLAFMLTAPPNVLLPNWWLEGVSVWAETEFAGRGRGNGSFYEMYFRLAVAEDDLPSVDMINGDPPDWPSGHRPYLYGLALMRHITSTYGPDTLKRLNMLHAGRLPYFISSPARKHTGSGYSALFSEAMKALKRDQSEKIRAIRDAGITEPAIYPAVGENTSNPSPSPGGRLLAVSVSDPHRHNTIAILNGITGQQIQELRVRPSDNRISWSRDSKTIYFTEAELEGGYNLYLDLYSYELATGEKHRLTSGMRVKEPDISRDGRIAVIGIAPEAQSLALLTPTAKGALSMNVLKEFTGMRLSNPSWSPDGSAIAFSARDDSGNAYLMAYDIASGEATEILSGSGSLDYPTFTPDGGKIIYISDETGVFNIYEYNITQNRLRRLTNLLGGALHPAMDEGGQWIYFSHYTSDGFRAAYIRYPEGETRDINAPLIRPTWPDEGFIIANSPAMIRTSEDTPALTNTPATRDASYSALSSALPRFWLPSLWGDHDGIGPALFTAGQDALFYHSYIFMAGTGGSGKGYGILNYRYDRLYASLNLEAMRAPVYYSGFFNSTIDLYDLEESAEAYIGLPIKRLEWEAMLSLGYQWKSHETLQSPVPVFTGRRDNIHLSLSFSNSMRYPFSISREEGRTITIEGRDYSTKRNSDVDAREYTARYEEFMGFSGNRALYFMLGGGASKGDQIPQQAFHLGGTSSDNLDYPVRGYKAGYRRGDYVAVSTLELRFPLLNIQRGPGTLPLFARQLHMALFVDGAAVWDKGQSLRRDMVDLGAGVELKLDMAIGYKIWVTPVIGYAHGFSKHNGEDIVYIAIQSSL